MTAASEALEIGVHALAAATTHANHLGKLLTLPYDDSGRSSMFVIPQVRQALARSMQVAADQCETIGCHNNDTRWVGVVGLIHNASCHVQNVHDAGTCRQIAALMERCGTIMTTLKDRATGREVSVRLS